MNPKIKIKREIVKRYLAYIRKQPCLVWGCPNKAEAHHDPSVGAGGSDLEALPLCCIHHLAAFVDGVHKLGKKTFQKKFDLDFNKERVRLLIGYIRQLK